MTDPILEFWDKQENEELQSVLAEAKSLGIDVVSVMNEASGGYRTVKKLGLNRAFVDDNIRSERDAILKRLRADILKSKAAR